VPPKVSVIIPFYQKEKGILPKAVKSVLTQKDYNNYEIIIVDDGSPVSASDEISDLQEKNPGKIRIIKQKNRGVAAAKNIALNNVASDTTYVAFLDSDDVWYDFHLWQGIYGLERGYDLYFSNFINFFDNKAHQKNVLYLLRG